MATFGMDEFTFHGYDGYRVAVMILRKLDEYRESLPETQRFRIGSSFYHGPPQKVVIEIDILSAPLIEKFTEQVNIDS